MKTILVTGADGQLGRSLATVCRADTQTGVRYVFTDIPELDITNGAAVQRFVEKGEYDCIVNCAAYTNVDGAENDTEAAHKLNAAAVKTLVASARSVNARLIHISTDFVFDGSGNIPYKEDDRVNPLSVYGKSKLEGEKAVLAYERGIVVRTAWLYSRYGRNFVNTIRRCAQQQAEIKVVVDQIGTPTFAGDLAAVLHKMAMRLLDPVLEPLTGLFHYSNEGLCSWYDFADAIVSISGHACRVLPVDSFAFPRPAKRPAYSVLNKARIKAALDIDIPHWRHSLEKCLAEDKVEISPIVDLSRRLSRRPKE